MLLCVFKSPLLKTKKDSLLNQLKDSLEGTLHFDDLHKAIYATDASVYRTLPLAVAFPKDVEDLKILIEFASKNNVSLIPRTAGTSLAGQCVGDGIVVDTSKHFTKILAFDELHGTVKVQPGVIRDELNEFLKPFGYFFGPNTSTSNRCMIGGMVGNNSSGTTSIKYGVTRDKVISLKTVLSDGSEATFESLSKLEFNQKCIGSDLENMVYRTLRDELSIKQVQDEIHKEFPKPEIHRRNTGYAVDALLKFESFGGGEDRINVAQLLAGSEGTLAFSTEIELKLDKLPPEHSCMVAAHFSSIEESMEAVVTAMKYGLYTCELMDKTILDCTKNNREQQKNRFFVDGDPEAILMLELRSDNPDEIETSAKNMIAELQSEDYGYAFPILRGSEINQALTLRSAGLGLLGNMVGDAKAVACIEDTAVVLEDLPAYISEFTRMMEEFNQKAVYYAHAGAGEIHLRPILNLKKQEDVKLFREITHKTAQLVKKYGGSFSGEHGDGIVRAEFIPLMIGEKNYELLKKIKQVFDPQNIFNPGKIIDAIAMDTQLRHEIDRNEPEIETLQNFEDSEGILRLSEKCNGSGDCRSTISNGVMCPSYRATKDEKDSTRARANALREFLTNSTQTNRFNHQELYEVFDLCLSCKACASECPSNVDVASLKAEFLHQYYTENGIPFRTKVFAESSKWNKLGSKFPGLTNTVLNTSLVKSVMGISTKRSVPKLASETFTSWKSKQKEFFENEDYVGELYLFVDEFSEYYDADIAQDAYVLLKRLGYKVNLVDSKESGRAFYSKGLLNEAKEIANANVEVYKDKVSEQIPLVGIEPSAIVMFKDEYARLADDLDAAKKVAENSLTFDEFISKEYKKGKIKASSFTKKSKQLKIHGHCQQKSLTGTHPTFEMLNIPENYNATVMITGCCGMAGSFGYEKEHYEISMKIGENSLFPKVRAAESDTIIVAAGTSCRHQIKDGTSRKAFHPITVLRNALGV